ncbi:hypothetical protein ACWGH2_28865 [Streptomyces sp. NPDC054871]
MFQTGCRLHGPSCRTAWGYDQQHTDSDHPYSVSELADRAEAPHRYAYATNRDYELGFYTWRSMRRDDRLSREEERAREPVILARLGIKGASFDEVIGRALEGSV